MSYLRLIFLPVQCAVCTTDDCVAQQNAYTFTLRQRFFLWMYIWISFCDMSFLKFVLRNLSEKFRETVYYLLAYAMCVDWFIFWKYSTPMWSLIWAYNIVVVNILHPNLWSPPTPPHRSGKRHRPFCQQCCAYWKILCLFIVFLSQKQLSRELGTQG